MHRARAAKATASRTEIAMSEPPNRFVLLLTTAGSAKEARSIARSLVERRLAACVNILGPMRSIYRWRGAVENAQEHLLLIKTRAEIYAQVERAVRDLHSYEVPEVLAIPIRHGSRPYLAWLAAETAAPPSPSRLRRTHRR